MGGASEPSLTYVSVKCPLRASKIRGGDCNSNHCEYVHQQPVQLYLEDGPEDMRPMHYRLGSADAAAKRFSDTAAGFTQALERHFGRRFGPQGVCDMLRSDLMRIEPLTRMKPSRARMAA
jgi:hypothetical protein